MQRWTWGLGVLAWGVAGCGGGGGWAPAHGDGPEDDSAMPPVVAPPDVTPSESPGPDEGVDEPAPACCSISASPAFGDEVDVTATMLVTFSEPVALDALAEAIELWDLVEDEPLPISVEAVDEHTVEVTPAHSLAFFGDYVLRVAAQATGGPCTDAEFVFRTRSPAAAPRPLRPAPAVGVALLGTTALTVSPNYRGLQVYDVADPTAPVLASDVLTEESPRGITVEGDRAYAPAGLGGVLIFDVANPSAPTLIGRAGTPGYASEVAAFSRDGRRLLAVADGVEGLRILDATEPEGAFTLARIDPDGVGMAPVLGVDLEGDLLAVAQVDAGFALVDLVDPSNPVVLSSTPSAARVETFGAPRPVTQVRLHEGAIFLAMNSYGIQAFDVTDPTAPFHLDHEIGPGGYCAQDCPDVIASMVMDDDDLVVASAMTGAARLVLEGDDLRTVSTHVVTGRAHAVAPAGEQLVVGTERGLAVFQADTDGSPPIYEELEGWGTIWDVEPDGARLFASSSSRGLESHGLENPLLPQPHGLFPTPGVERDYGLLDLRMHQDLLFVGDGRAGLAIYDATTEQPELLGRLDQSDGVGAMHLDGSSGYACSGNWAFWVIEFADPSSPVRIPVDIPVQIGGCNDLAVRGQTLYVAGGRGIGVYDISAPSQPELLGVHTLPASDVVLSLVLGGDHLYAATYVQDFEGIGGTSQRLTVFDVSDPWSPSLVHRTDDLGGITDLLLRGDKLFVGGRRQGVMIYGLSDPDVPTLEGVVGLPGVTYSLKLGGQENDHVLYVAQLGGGIGAIALGGLR